MNIYLLILLVITSAEFFIYPNFHFLKSYIRVVDLLILASFLAYVFDPRYGIRKILKNCAKESFFKTGLSVLMVSYVVSSFFSQNKLISLKETVQLIESLWLVYFFFSFVNSGNLHLIFKTGILTALFHVFFSFFFQYLPNEGDIYMLEIVRLSGLSGGYFATHLLAVLVFVFIWYLRSEFNVLRLLLCSVFFTFIILTQIRTVWIVSTVLLVLPLFLKFDPGVVKKIFIFLLVSFSLVFFLSNWTSSSWAETYKNRGLDTAKIRIGLWKSAVNIFKNNPVLGSGPGTFGLLYHENATPEDSELFSKYKLGHNIDAHSPFFTRLSETGLAGVFSWLFLFVLIFFTGKRPLGILASKTAYSFYVFFLMALVSDFFSDVLGGKLFWIILGIFIKISSETIPGMKKHEY